ncbi:MAG: AsmA-like C-terminal region-containing protein [Pseudomonadota bacterium]
MVRQTAPIIILEIVVGLVLVAAIAVVSVLVRLSSGPIDLQRFRGTMEQNIAEARGGHPVTIGEVTLEWLRSERRVVVVASDLVFFDDDNAIVAEAKQAELLVSTTGLLSGDFHLLGLDLTDGRVEVRRTDDAWIVAGDRLGPVSLTDNASRDDPTIRSLVEDANAGLVEALGVLKVASGNVDFETLRFDGLHINMIDETEGTTASLRDAEGEILRSQQGLSAVVSGDSDFGEDGPGRFRLELSLPADYSELNASFGFKDWSVASVLQWIPSPPMNVGDIPASVSLDFLVDDKSGLSNLDVDLDIGRGEMTMANETWTVERISAQGQYTLETDQLILDISSFEAGPLQTSGRLEMDTLLRSDGSRPFRLTFPDLTLDLQPAFSRAWSARRFRLNGTAWPWDRKIDVERMSLSTGEADLIATGGVEFLRDLQSGDLPVKMDLVAEMSGSLPHDEFLKFWPLRQGVGARNYVKNNVLEGVLTDATFVFAFDRRSRVKGYFEDDTMDGTFSVSGVSVRPLSDVPPILESELTGTMTGNSVKLDFTGGRFASWEIDGGFVHYPELSPPGADMMVSVSGKGPARNMVQIISDSRLKLQERTGFNPSELSGEAALVFNLVRPALPDVPPSEYRYNAEGQIRGGGLANVALGYDLKDSDARVQLDQDGIHVYGFGNISGVPLQYDWRNGFRSDAGPGELTASGILTPSGLNEMGVPARAYFSGEAPMLMEAELNGSRLEDVNATVDFSSSRLDVSELGWIKPAGSPASLAIEISQGENGSVDLLGSFEAETAAVEADVTIEETGRMLRADVDRAFLLNKADIYGKARRGEDNSLVFNVGGAFLDLSEVMGNLTGVRSGGSDIASRVGKVAMEAEIDQLRLREGFDMLSAKMQLASTEDGLKTIEATGLTQTGADFTAAYDASGLGDPSFLVTSGDASFIASVFLGLDALEDGELEMSGTLASGDLPTQVRVEVTDARLKDAPLFTQVLGLASIRGVSDMISGEGVLFTEIDIPLAIAGGRYNVIGAKASGPALGMTANGWVNTQSGGLDLSGVLVPSFGLNSALGGIPLIGDLFVSRDGEGLISLRYGIEGTLDRAEVSVNPLSAVTPGVLRRIFENPGNDDVLDSLESGERASVSE